MKIRYFKNNKEYFKFIDKNKDKDINTFICTFTKKYIKVIYQFI